ncbi:NUDIX domain-containing protein [Flavisolibacter ginsengisoli]|jgi:nudix-type nucleoside diphosphatase (YffH/AdpP family)|uniref:GDP-mannose pyrophosphatase n=1 Tax=Flavisolibacter ginsengisoli DSM 18119 TaxID=1121884 RepID=A0A1M4VC28_9BACT|nr:NUDIX domain-containing protein [Flavisolibacter ginsengisoli]SHE66398.1 nudix-type nucleoside diphosphatase, YffH/AdpP family [Flavisolibacter ginsengisoli DSM 18119]
MGDVTIKNSETLSKWKHELKKIQFERTSKSGSTQSQEREVYDHGNAVAALLYNKQKGTVLLTRQFRLPAYLNDGEGMLLEACAGLVENGEEPEATMKREIKEEMGYEIEQLQKIFEVYSSPGSLKELLFLFVGEYDQQQKVADGGGLKDEGEDIEVVEMPLAEVIEKASSGQIRDAKTVILILWLQQKQLV